MVLDNPKVEQARLIKRIPELSHVLLPLSNLDEAKLLIPFANIITAACQGQLTILTFTPVPEGIHPSEVAGQASRFREALDSLITTNLNIIPQIKTLVRPQEEVWEGIWEVVFQDSIDVLIFCWSTSTFPHTTVGNDNDPLLSTPPCNLISIYPSTEMIPNGDWQSIRRILLPLRSSYYASLVLRTAHDLAVATDAQITLLHASDNSLRQAQTQMSKDFGPAILNLKRLTRSLTVVSDVSEAIINEASDHQVIVMGAPTSQVSSDGWSGPLLDAVAAGSQATLIVVKTGINQLSEVPGHIDVERPHVSDTLTSLHTKSPLPVNNHLAMVVDTWFAENTFHSREFADLERLVSLKDTHNLTISLGLPALNESETVGKVINVIKTALMDEIALLDEIVLIDSGSIDNTREIALDLGIPVFVHHDILPQYGAYHGKGEALWKSLYVLKGDIIAWIDTDINNIHPRFVYGILGPLLQNPNIQYVKGFYRRPFKEGDKIIAGGGGRVTELTARPLINMFFPELSGIIQPLSGEYAGRRKTLENTPFYTGYGVETGLLIDLMDEYGIHSIAQVDLLERIHHNQPLPSLSKMSFAIMQVVFSRLEKQHNIHMLDNPNLTMNLIRYRPRRRYYLDPEEICEGERPPIATIPEYRQAHGLPPVNKYSTKPPGESTPAIEQL
jgi:nucleotide-binding universal stress UspA family protein